MLHVQYVNATTHDINCYLKVDLNDDASQGSTPWIHGVLPFERLFYDTFALLSSL